MIINNTAPIDNFLPYYCFIFFIFLGGEKGALSANLECMINLINERGEGVALLMNM